MNKVFNILLFILSFLIVFSVGISYGGWPGECQFVLMPYGGKVPTEEGQLYTGMSTNLTGTVDEYFVPDYTVTTYTGDYYAQGSYLQVWYWDVDHWVKGDQQTVAFFRAPPIDALIDGDTLPPEGCPETCEEKEGDFYKWVRYPGIFNITRDCIDGCEISITTGQASQSLSVYMKDDDNNYWTYGDAYYTGQECTEGQQSEVPPPDEVPTCPEFLDLCDKSCMGNVTFKSCDPNDSSNRLCTCNGQAPPHIDLGGDWKPDSDLDGEPNQSDPDIDGDGKTNGDDDDTDGDGIPNINDSDVDNDGISNGGIKGWSSPSGSPNGVGSDPNVDGDEHDNRSDTDVDGDGNSNGNDSDVDGDGVKNNIDNDVDGDGYLNWEDSDIDGDGLPNDMDADPYGNAVVNSDTNEDGTVDGTDENTGDNGTDGSASSSTSTSTSTGGSTEGEGEEGEEPTGSDVPFGYTASGSLETAERINFDNIKTGVNQLKETGPFQLIEQISELKDVLITAPEVPEFRIEITPSDFIFGHHYINVSLESWEPVLEIMRFFLGIYFLVLCLHFNIRQWNS